MRNRIRLLGGKETEIFHLDNQVGAIAFIPVLNVIYYLVTLVTARGRRFALFLETVLLLAIGSLLIRLSTGWLLGAVFAHVLTCIGIDIQQQLLDASPDSRKKLGYIILLSAVFVLAMLAIAFASFALRSTSPSCFSSQSIRWATLIAAVSALRERGERCAPVEGHMLQ